jgi:hypothetical protein
LKRRSRRRAAELVEQPGEGIRGNGEHGTYANASAPWELRGEPSSGGLTLQIGVVLPAEHPICLVHLALLRGHRRTRTLAVPPYTDLTHG